MRAARGWGGPAGRGGTRSKDTCRSMAVRPSRPRDPRALLPRPGRPCRPRREGGRTLRGACDRVEVVQIVEPLLQLYARKEKLVPTTGQDQSATDCAFLKLVALAGLAGEEYRWPRRDLRPSALRRPRKKSQSTSRRCMYRFLVRLSAAARCRPRKDAKRRRLPSSCSNGSFRHMLPRKHIQNLEYAAS